MDLKNLLNEEQYEAATTIDGPILILAGAGSGKTRTITHRIAHMIMDLSIKSYEILAITFTNKAASEMKERVRSLIGEIADYMWISTFHSLCVRILRREIEKLGYTKSFTIYDSYDQKTLVKQCMELLQVNSKNIEINEIIGKISKYKNDFISPKEAVKSSSNYREEIIAKVYELYEKKLRENNSLDFDNLIFKTIELLEKYPEVLEFYQSKFKYIMVDEYQDTNYVQYRLIRLFAIKNQNICVVGDDDQCIYQWRGADINNILDFEKDYKNTKVIKLEKNYRSKGNILSVANQIITNNFKRKDKILKTTNPDGDKIKLFKAGDSKEEAMFVANEISRIINETEYEYKDFVVLYRTNAQSRLFEEIFVQANMPYKLFGGVRFYERKEIKDIMSYLKVVINRDDEVSLRRIINEPKRSIGDTTVDKLLDYAVSMSISLFDTLECCNEINSITARATNSIKGFVDIICGLREKLSLRPSEFIKVVLEETGYLKMLKESKELEAKTRIENLEELVSAATNFENINNGTTIEEFIESTTLVSDVDKYEETSQAVTLMTLHSSKGLEFPIVYIVGMENGLFPSNKCFEDSSEMEESRRLCYVGITRAKDKLYLTYANLRVLYGETKFQVKSQFLTEIPKDLIENVDFLGESIVLKSQEKVNSFNNYGYNPDLNKPTTKNNITQDEIKIGMKIKHSSFGLGTIISISPENDDVKLSVAFDNMGIKKLFLNKSPIEFI